MPGRTWLTTPPGSEPLLDERGEPDRERYVPGLDLPREPRVPGRHRRAWVVAATVVIALLLVLAVLWIGEQSQQEDPSVPVPEAEDGSLPE